MSNFVENDPNFERPNTYSNKLLFAKLRCEGIRQYIIHVLYDWIRDTWKDVGSNCSGIRRTENSQTTDDGCMPSADQTDRSKTPTGVQTYCWQNKYPSDRWCSGCRAWKTKLEGFRRTDEFPLQWQECNIKNLGKGDVELAVEISKICIPPTASIGDATEVPFLFAKHCNLFGLIPVDHIDSLLSIWSRKFDDPASIKSLTENQANEKIILDSVSSICHKELEKSKPGASVGIKSCLLLKEDAFKTLLEKSVQAIPQSWEEKFQCMKSKIFCPAIKQATPEAEAEVDAIADNLESMDLNYTSESDFQQPRTRSQMCITTITRPTQDSAAAGATDESTLRDALNDANGKHLLSHL